MKKKILISVVFACVVFFVSAPGEAASKKDSYYYHDTVLNNVWDWVTTVGKSPQEKKRITTQHRTHRAKVRYARDQKKNSAAIEAENKQRQKQDEKMQQLRLKEREERIRELKERAAAQEQKD